MSQQSDWIAEDGHQNGDEPEDDPRHLGDTLIWGTTVVVQTCMNIFRLFIENFTLENNDATTTRLISHFYTLCNVINIDMVRRITHSSILL